MSHIVGRSAYKSLEERLNKFPQGSPPSETLYKILGVMFSEKEAALVARLPIRYFTARTASRIWKLDELSTQKILQDLASRALLLDVEHQGVQKYVLPPPMAGFFEFTLMRTSGGIDQRLLSELFNQYLNVEEEFVKELFWGTETKMGRVFVQEESLPKYDAVHILDYERSSHIIESASFIGVSTCYCRHKMHHLGKDCYAPMEVCLTFGNTAASLTKHNHARRIETSEALEILQQSYENNLVQCGENVREEVSFMCNCCGCCCEALVAAREFAIPHPIQTTNFIPRINDESCIKCGRCVKSCPIDAIEIKTVQNSSGNKIKIIHINEDLCLGCGVCVRNCYRKGIYLESRKQRVITPVNTVHRLVLMAIEKGTLQNLIFDKQALRSHKIMGAVLAVILKLPPIKQAMASKQLKSVYLDRLISKVKL
jgi:Pyruvate/2-oxoacid:ferredoxin oxidoreductase delta subunit